MRMRRPRLVSSLALLATFATLSTARADVLSAGLSGVGAKKFQEENLAFFTPAAQDHFATALAAGDFNGDGAEDLATGVPDDDGIAGLCVDCGAVVVRYGIPGRGLDPAVATAFLSQQQSG